MGLSDLPGYPVPFVGRTVELDAVRTALASGRYVEILGPAGVGKSRLAVQAARLEASGWDEVCWVPFEAVDETARLAAYVAGRLGMVAPSMRHSDLMDVLADRGHTVLVVLDGAEHVAAEARRLVRALTSASNVGVILTSRRRIDTGLAVEVQPLTAEAIEGPPAIGRLPEAQRQVLASLAAFRGGGTVEAVAAVAALTEAECSSALAELGLRGLIETGPGDVGTRFWLPGVVRDAVSEHVSAPSLPSAHASYFGAWGAAVAGAVRWMTDGTLRHRLAAERSNLTAAAAWALASDDLASAASALVGLGAAAELCGFADDVYGLGRQVWAHPARLEHPAFLLTFGNMLLDTDRFETAEEVFRAILETREGSHRAGAWRGLARCASNAALDVDARELADRAIEVSVAAGDRYEEAVSRRLRGAVCAHSPDCGGAAESLAEAVRAFGALGAVHDEAQCEVILAWHWGIRRQPELSLSSARRAERLASDLGDRRLLLEARLRIGLATLDLGQWASAQRFLGELLADCRRTGASELTLPAAEALLGIKMNLGDTDAVRELSALRGRLTAGVGGGMVPRWERPR